MDIKSAGKGSKPRPFSSYAEYSKNYDQIAGFNFGKKKNVLRVHKYPYELKLITKALFGVEDAFLINDYSSLNTYDPQWTNPKVEKLLSKYGFDNSVRSMYIWELVEKMYNYLPF